MSLFRTFIAFCISVNAPQGNISVECMLSFLEYLTIHRGSVHMVTNYVSAVKAMASVYGLNINTLDDKRIKYFIKALKVNRPLAVVKRNVMDIHTLKHFIQVCSAYSNARIYKALFLCAFFVFFRLSNLVPHTVGSFDPIKQFAGGDVVFGKNVVTLILKWSKTLQTRDQVRSISLTKLQIPSICPYKALRSIFQLYNPTQNAPLFQVPTVNGWVPLMDSRVCKRLSQLNIAMNLPKNYYTFHAFRRSGASLAYHSKSSIQ